jgi:glycosyltransferase involved in cell wall biosynthesis
MSKRPTISLCCILKNEERNLHRLLSSIEGCFDEIHLTDTGSTDNSIAMIAAWAASGRDNPAKAPIHLHHFSWVDDFAAARNASFRPATTDYVAWLDLDDVLTNREAFLSWRNSTMKLADFWLATYHYAVHADGRPSCSFARERVVRNRIGLKWSYFVHEGMLPGSATKDVAIQYAPTWSVTHCRDAEDLKADRSRNLALFEKRKGSLDARMRYYYGKELFENGRPLEAFGELVNAVAEPQLELHDRVMGVQYACFSAIQLGQYEKAISLAMQGLALAPQRAEFFVVAGDCFLKQNRVADAVPFYEAAHRCGYQGGAAIQGAIFQQEDAYRHYPLNMLARIFLNAGDPERAAGYVSSALKLGENAESLELERVIDDVREKIRPLPGLVREKTTDIVISSPPGGLYEWDEAIYKTKGIGGSETAAVEMAKWLASLTGRRVIVFNNVTEPRTFGGVEYRPSSGIPDYFRRYSPALHVAWRHALKLSEDPTYVWSHDLAFQGVENAGGYTGILALSEFHKSYLKNFFGVPDEKILLTRNGLEPKRFETVLPKEEAKIIYSSSPDRGLDRAMLAMDEIVKREPKARLHVYYGFENMRLLGRHAEVAALEKMISERPYVVFHGNVTQAELTQEMKTACVWLYPTNFLETYCITAIEMLSAGVYPVVRRWGALEDTLKMAEARGEATLLDEEGNTPESAQRYADAVCEALKHRRYLSMRTEPKEFSWESVAEEWISLFSLREESPCQQSSSMQARTA